MLIVWVWCKTQKIQWIYHPSGFLLKLILACCPSVSGWAWELMTGFQVLLSQELNEIVKWFFYVMVRI